MFYSNLASASSSNPPCSHAQSVTTTTISTPQPVGVPPHTHLLVSDGETLDRLRHHVRLVHPHDGVPEPSKIANQASKQANARTRFSGPGGFRVSMLKLLSTSTQSMQCVCAAKGVHTVYYHTCVHSLSTRADWLPGSHHNPYNIISSSSLRYHTVEVHTQQADYGRL